MRQYLDLCAKALGTGIRKTNRTGIDHIGYTGDMAQYDLRDGFPAVTTKKLAFKTVVAEMLGFLRGYDSAEQFRELGCRVWDANANDNESWLNNPWRAPGKDDLGRIYGVQAREWRRGDGVLLDQLKAVVDDLSQGIDNRREIVTHWNPGELDQMALPPCHLLYQFGIQGEYLNLSMYQRSCDLPLGVPFNVAGYAWLLTMIAHITGHKPGTFTHFMHDVHIYENQVDLMHEQLTRGTYELPTLEFNPAIKTLHDLDTWVRPHDFELAGYKHHPAIDYPFAV